MARYWVQALLGEKGEIGSTVIVACACDGNIRRRWSRLNWALFGLFLPAGSFFSRAAGANTGEKLIEASGRIFTSLMVSCILRFGGVV